MLARPVQRGVPAREVPVPEKNLLKVQNIEYHLNMQVLLSAPGQFRIVYEHLCSRLVVPPGHRHHPLFDIQGSMIVCTSSVHRVCVRNVVVNELFIELS